MNHHFGLLRISSQFESTIGHIYKYEPSESNPKNDFRCFTLEDRFRKNKVLGETRIPGKNYEIKFRATGGMHKRYSKKYPWHHGMLHLQNVPGFTYIYIHNGQTSKATEGCILVGGKVNQNITKQGLLNNSLSAYKKLYLEISSYLLKGDKVFIHINNFG